MNDAVRQEVRHRAGDRCEYCLLPQESAPLFRFHIEHIRARQHGGSDTLENLALACPNCNHHKGPNLTSIDPETEELVELFNPRLARWEEHFRVIGAQLRGLTPVGRATIKLLAINSDAQLRIREALIKRFEWP